MPMNICDGISSQMYVGCVYLSLCVWQHAVLVYHVVRVSQSGVWECEEETRWGSRLMKNLVLPHMHAHTDLGNKHIRSNTQSEVFLQLLQITQLHGNTLIGLLW